MANHDYRPIHQRFPDVHKTPAWAAFERYAEGKLPQLGSGEDAMLSVFSAFSAFMEGWNAAHGEIHRRAMDSKFDELSKQNRRF